MNDTKLRNEDPPASEGFFLNESIISSYIERRRSEPGNMRTLRQDISVAQDLLDYFSTRGAVTAEGIAAYREQLQNKGLAPATVTAYIKSANRLLTYLGHSECRVKPGRKPVDLSGRRFGGLTVLNMTDKRNRRSIVWECRCDCGRTLEVPSVNLVLNRTVSCGCGKIRNLQQSNRYFANTSLRRALQDDPLRSKRGASGFVGVTEKRGRFRASIVYRGRYHYLGTFRTVEEAVKARARAKERVQEDARQLERIYEQALLSQTAERPLHMTAGPRKTKGVYIA